MVQGEASSVNDLLIVEASHEHYQELAAFLNQNIQTHRHLDWFSSLDWIGDHPYLIQYEEDTIQGVLCTTPENKDTAWIRVFAVAKPGGIDEPWQQLLLRAIQKLRDEGVRRLAALALHSWFEALLVHSDFQNRQNINVLEWQGQLPPKTLCNPAITIRPMTCDDLLEVQRIDALAFPPLWQNSLAGLTKALKQTGISTVAILDDKLVGYQISTSMTICGHLARLAVDPNYQRQRIAYTLVYDLLQKFEDRGLWRVTVNTQSDNFPSLNLYEKFGFSRTKEEIKVFELFL